MDTARWLLSGEPLANLGIGGRRGVALLVLAALLAVWTERQTAVFAIGAFLALAGTAWLWAERALSAVEARHELLDPRAFPGDTVRVRLIARNAKLLPLAWLRVRSAIPPALTPTGTPRGWPGIERGGFLQGMAALPWGGSAVWEFELPCRTRGVHTIGPIELSSGDPLGLFARRSVRPESREIVVYPKVVPLRRLGFPLSAGFGAAARRRSIQEDPSRSAGVRDYRPGDPLRRVHWKATARQGELQVRLLEPAAAPALLLILAADTFDFPWTRYREDLFELAMSALASIAWRALEDGWQVGLLANTASQVSLMPASSPDQIGQVLEALARAGPGSGGSLADLVDVHAHGLRRATFALAIGRMTNPVQSTIARLAAARQPLFLLYGEEPTGLPGRLPGYRLRQWDDLATTLEGPGETLDGR